MSDRFHRAARDGYLNALKEATKRDCNQTDEDGLTPTSIAAYEGNLDALRLLVGRGGDPEKCDYYGNTALHCAAARGHMNCVSFLVNFGVNVYALDNEMHSAKDLAAINDKEDILRYLDLRAASQEKADLKKAKKLQEKSKKDAEKRQKEFEKLQRKTDKRRQNEEERLQKEREKINNQENINQNVKKKTIFDTFSKSSLTLMTGNKNEPKVIHANNKTNSRKFSELTQNAEKNSNNKVTLSAIQNKIIKKKAKEEDKSTNNFKVRETEGDGKKSVRNLSGLQRDSEILFVPNGSLSSAASESPTFGKRGKLSEVFETDEFEDFPKDARLHGSIFDRPGFGSVAFRSSITNTLSSMKSSTSEDSNSSSHPANEDVIDTSLESQEFHHNSPLTPWEEEEDYLSDDEEEASPLFLFLLANDLQNFMPIFSREQIDLEAMMLLTDQDLETLKLPLGPRRKILRALNDRKLALEDPGEVTDVRL